MQGRRPPRSDLLVIFVVVELWSHRVWERRHLGSLAIAFGLAALFDNASAVVLLLAFVAYLVPFSPPGAANVVYDDAKQSRELHQEESHLRRHPTSQAPQLRVLMESKEWRRNGQGA